MADRKIRSRPLCQSCRPAQGRQEPPHHHCGKAPGGRRRRCDPGQAGAASEEGRYRSSAADPRSSVARAPWHAHCDQIACHTLRDCVDAMATVMGALAKGSLSSIEASELAGVIEAARRACKQQVENRKICEGCQPQSVRPAQGRNEPPHDHRWQEVAAPHYPEVPDPEPAGYRRPSSPVMSAITDRPH
jgi:hypothetical protein